MSLPAPLLVQSLKDAKEAIRVGRSLLDNLQTQQWERCQSGPSGKPHPANLLSSARKTWH